MKKFYLTYKDFQSLDSNATKEIQNLVNSLLLSHKKGVLTALEKEQKFILEGEFNEEDAKQLKEYGFKEIRLFEVDEVNNKKEDDVMNIDHIKEELNSLQNKVYRELNESKSFIDNLTEQDIKNNKVQKLIEVLFHSYDQLLTFNVSNKIK